MSTQFRFREAPPDTDDAESIRAWAERTRRVGAPGYTRAAEYHPLGSPLGQSKAFGGRLMRNQIVVETILFQFT